METKEHILRSSKPTKLNIVKPDPNKSFRVLRTAGRCIGVTLAIAILIYYYFKQRSEL